MEKELEQFRQEVARQREGRQGGSGPFPEALRAFAVRYLAHCLEKGETVQAVVKRLGVSGPTLQAWRRGRTPGSKSRQQTAPALAALVPVVVPAPKRSAASAPGAQAGLTLVSPGGWRVEGLTEEGVAGLLGRLRC